jgi:predicted Rossmann-fold nucleotide-binding protein
VALIGGSEAASADTWRALIGPVAQMFAVFDCTLAYCGMGTGLAGAIAKQYAARGGNVKAVVIRGDEPPDVPSTAIRVVVSDYYARQRTLFNGAAALLVLPGGTGTLAELTTAAALRGAGLLDVPIVVLDPDDWFAPVVKWYERAVKDAVSRVSPTQMFTVVRTDSEARHALVYPLNPR